MTLSEINIYRICLLAGAVLYPSAGSKLVTSQAFTRPYQNITSEIRRQDVIYRNGKALCPYSDSCRRTKEVNYDFKMAPCCAECSCDDSCWETGTCCPDKEVIDEREPFQSCHESLVKKSKGSTVDDEINKIIWSYFIIDHCPESEQNVSIIKKCTLTDIDHINDYRWVSDKTSGTIYQNKFCAACHGRKNVTRWQLVTRCEDALFANFYHLNSLLLSDKCDIINREPGEGSDAVYKRCIVSFYTRCNQSGLWTNYDPDIVWACDMHSSVFSVIVNRNTTYYKNAFCYACNQPGIENTPTMCMKVFDVPDKLSLRILIDYERYDTLGHGQTTSNSVCEIYEIFDPYLLTCRRLICPFAHVPVYGNCKQLVEKTHGLSVEVLYTLSVLWSRADYILKDNTGTFLSVSNEIFQEVRRRYNFLESGMSCPFCNQELRFLNEIGHPSGGTNNITSDPEEGKQHKRSNYTKQPNFIFSSISYTKENCQVPNLLPNALNLSGSEIEIIPDGTTAMVLHVELLTENVQTLINVSRIIISYSTLPNCPVTYKLRTQNICPKINISVTEFEHLMWRNNTGIINSMFTSENTHEKGYTEICVDDYLDKLSYLDFGLYRNSGSFEIHVYGFSFMIVLGIAHLLRMKA